MESMGVNSTFWKGKSVFLTGHTGIKGAWLALWLRQLGAEIHGYALKPPTEPNFFSTVAVSEGLASSTLGDLRELDLLETALFAAKPTVVIHMAAQALVRDSYVDPVTTYSTNVMGTVNLLEAVRKTSSVQAVLNITSDKCYENKEWLWGYRENDSMGGHDPYSSSKGCAELVTSAYYRSFFKGEGVAVATARAGNVIGGGDWAKDRIVPDAIRAFINNEPLVIRNPASVRPWQHVLEPLAGYLMLCQKLVQDAGSFSGGWNFGPGDDSAQPVSFLADILVGHWGESAQWQVDQDAHPHEAVTLKLDCSKAKSRLGWKPAWALEKSLIETVSWYKAWQQQEEMKTFSLGQIAAYSEEHLSA